MTFEADDGWASSQARPQILSHTAPDVEIQAPFEPSTGTSSDVIVTGEETQLRATAVDEDGEIVEAIFHPRGPDAPAIDASHEDGVYVANLTYAETDAGEQTIVFEAMDDDGINMSTTRPVEVVQNTGPVVDAGQAGIVNATEEGTRSVSLRGDALDPEQRPLNASSFEWTLPASAIDEDASETQVAGDEQTGGGDTSSAQGSLSSPTLTHTFPAGTHTVSLSLTDAHGASATDTVDVQVDDALFASVAFPWTDPGEVGISQRPSVLVDVVDDRGEGLVDTGEVAIVHEPTGMEGTRFSAATGEDGFSMFLLPYDVGEGEAGLNLRGEHTLTVRAEHPSRPQAPIQDVEHAVATLTHDVDWR